MLMMPIAEARAQFSSVLERVQAGEEIGITKGKKAEPIVVIIPWSSRKEKKLKKRKLGDLEHWGVTDIDIKAGGRITDEYMLGLPEGSLNHLLVKGDK